MLCGGWNETSELSEEQYDLALSLKGDIEAAVGAAYEHFVPVKIRQQVVAGMNYWVKYQVGEADYVHAKIFKPLPHTGQPANLVEAHPGKTLEDQL